MTGFYVSFNLEKLEAMAAGLGFWGPLWKQSVLSDLLHGGKLHVEQSHDPRDPSKRVWYCRGHEVSVACVPDTYLDDTLFCIGMVFGPAKGGPTPKGTVFEAPGPWSLHTFGRRPPPPIAVERHLLKCSADAAGGASAKDTPIGKFSSVMPDALKRRIIEGGTAAVVQAPPAAPTRKEAAGARGAAHAPVPARAPVRAPASTAVMEEPRASDTGATAPGISAAALAASPPCAGPSARPVQLPDAVVEATGPTNGGDHHDAAPEPVGESAADAGTGFSEPVGARQPQPVGPEAVPAAPAAEAVPPPAPRVLEGHADWSGLASAAFVQENAEFDGLIGAPDPLDARRRRISRLEAEISVLETKLRAVPAEAALADAEDARRRIADVSARAPGPPPPRVEVRGPKGLLAALQALTDEAAEALPRWVTGVDWSEAEPRLSILADVTRHERVQAALAWVRQVFAGAPPERLRDVPPPPGADIGSDVVALLIAAWALECESEEIAQNLPDEVRRWLRTRPIADARIAGHRLRAWRDALDEQAFRELGEAVQGTLDGRVPDPAPLPELTPEDLEILKGIRTYTLASKHVTRTLAARSGESPPVQRPPAPAVQVPERVFAIESFGHVVTDEHGRLVAPALTVPDAVQGRTYVPLEVPVRVLASAIPDRDAYFVVSSPHFDGVPANAVLPDGFEVQPTARSREVRVRLDARSTAWRPHDTGGLATELVLVVPVTIGEATRMRQGKVAKFAISCSWGEVSNSLNFESFTSRAPELASGAGIGMAAASELVRGRPLGAQVQHEKLEGVVDEGRESFMVVAPRRFGKTTLLDHLLVTGRNAGHAVVKVALQRDVAPEVAAARIWEALREGLEEQFKASPPLGAVPPKALFDEAAWKRVRSFVGSQGKATLVVLIDEAQALVPRMGGQAWGHRFKNFVENHLKEPAKGLAVVQYGLFGTVDLAVRVGPNCRDFLLNHGTEQHSFDETSLARFLRTVGQGAVLSSKAARQELAAWANNLKTLNVLLGRIRARLAGGRRAFIVQPDVASALHDLLGPNGSADQEIWPYAQAELSHADEWDPVDSFPMAVAWARPEVRDLGPADRLASCVDWLSAELKATGALGTVLVERLEDALRDLKVRGVLRENGEFWRPLLRELLARRRTIFRDDGLSRLALLRLAVDRIEWPENAEAKASGGQARVFVRTDGERTLAYRACTLESDTERGRFARACSALRTLRDRRTKLPGDDHLPRIRHAGFRADDPGQGVFVYEWVEGGTLEDLWKTLPAHARCYVVQQTAHAVMALHERDIIHCDIAPRNIIVGSRLDATLIDFGLARRADHGSKTRFAQDQFKAPEQCDDVPTIEKASDVYALGRLLLGPGTDRDELAPGVRTLAERMVAPTAGSRPSIREVVEVLDGLIAFEPILEQLKSRVDDIIAEAPGPLWEELFRAQTAAALVPAGFLTWDVQRAMEVSLLLNNLFAKAVAMGATPGAIRLAEFVAAEQGDSKEISLARVKSVVGKDDPSMAAWRSPDVKAVGLLRIALAHPTERDLKLDAAANELKRRRDQLPAAMRDASLRVAMLIDQLAGSTNAALRRFVEFYVGLAGKERT